MLCYTACGLHIHADRRIPGLSPSPPLPECAADVHVALGSIPEALTRGVEQLFHVVRGDEHSQPALRVWRAQDGAYFRLVYLDGTEFVVDAAGRHIWARWPEASTLEDTATYLLGPVLGFILRRRGITCLHASAVEIDGSAVAFAGPAYSGKSTLAAAFAGMGHRVLTDDVLALGERHGTVWATPAYAQLRLWQETVALLYGPEADLPRLTPNWEKRALSLDTRAAFAPEPLRLAAVYLLDPRVDEAHACIEPLSAREALLTLLANTYVNYLLEPSQRREEFALLSRLVAHVPVRRLSAGTGKASFPLLRQRILQQITQQITQRRISADYAEDADKVVRRLRG